MFVKDAYLVLFSLTSLLMFCEKKLKFTFRVSKEYAVSRWKKNISVEPQNIKIFSGELNFQKIKYKN